jgi:hypothetical protein
VSRFRQEATTESAKDCCAGNEHAHAANNPTNLNRLFRDISQRYFEAVA